MKNYKIYDVEARTTKTGKELKKLTIQGEGDQYPKKNVTMWSDHPLFTMIAAGQSQDLEIQETDGNPNPQGGFYKDRVVLKPGQTPMDVPKMRSDTDTQQKLDAIIVSLRRLEEKLETLPIPKVPGTDIDYPEMDSTNNGQPGVEITSEDVPF